MAIKMDPLELLRAMEAGEIKIPDPITAPITNAVVGYKLILLDRGFIFNLWGYPTSLKYRTFFK